MSEVAFSSWGRQVVDNRKGGDAEVEVANKKLPVTFDGKKQIAAFMGWDGLILNDPDVDVVAMAAEYARRVQEDYCCAKCSPGKKGTRVLQDTLARIVAGEGEESDLATIEKVAELLQNCKCTLCMTSAIPVMDTKIGRAHVELQSLRRISYAVFCLRSEERRVGKECSEPCRSRWSPYH